MATSLPPSFGLPISDSKRKLSMTLRPRAQSSARDEGKSSSVSIVDSNMGVLKERMEMVRMEERLERCRIKRYEGWNYQLYCDMQVSNGKADHKLVAEWLGVAELVLGTVGLTIFGCTLCLCLVSFLVHLG